MMPVLTTINMQIFWKKIKEYRTDPDCPQYFINEDDLIEVITDATVAQKLIE